MASLRSIILDNKFASLGERSEEVDDVEALLADKTAKALISRETVLVNATAVCRDFIEGLNQERFELLETRRIPCPKPPFHQMWLESYHVARVGAPVGRIGALVQRVDVAPEEDPVHAYSRFGEPWADLFNLKEDNCDLFRLMRDDHPANIVLGQVWLEVSSCCAATYNGGFQYWLDSNGNFQHYVYMIWPPPPTQEAADATSKSQLSAFMLWSLHTFARLNCHNVKLVPQKAGAPSPKQQRKHAPSCVWHEIVVEDVQLRTKRDESVPGEKQELRFHRVRGHYADYTKGAGLFGRYKVRIWVEEHSRGNHEVGEVVATYKVKTVS